MPYVILQKKGKGSWQVASSTLAATEHSAVAQQKKIEQTDPAFDTARIWVDLPEKGK